MASPTVCLGRATSLPRAPRTEPVTTRRMCRCRLRRLRAFPLDARSGATRVVGTGSNRNFIVKQDALTRRPQRATVRAVPKDKRRCVMGITLNHTIVPAHDKNASAQFLARILGLKAETISHFAAVRINDTLTLDYDDRDTFEWHHYAFQVGDEEFDAIFSRVNDASLSYTADPFGRGRGDINHRLCGLGFYFLDPNGHILEVLTRA